MQLYRELNIIEDKKLYNTINLFSLVVLIVAAGIVVMAQLIMFGEFHLSFTISNYLWIIGIFLVSLPIHELFYGLLFRFFSNEGQNDIYGFFNGVLFTYNPD